MSLRPISGDPDTVLAIAADLKGQAARLYATARVLAALAGSAPAVWDGPAGAVFGSRARAAVPALQAVTHRYAVAAAALVPLAAALQEAQAVVAHAVAEHAEAEPLFHFWGNAMSAAQASTDPSQQAMAIQHHARMVREGERVQAAERRHAEAWQHWHAADQRCAAVLARLTDDWLADPVLYDGLVGASDAAAGVAAAAGVVAAVPLPPCKAFGVVELAATGVQVGADATVLVGYGDGDWQTIGLTAVATAAGPLSTVVRKTATATRATDSVVDLGPRNLVEPRRAVLNDTLPDATLDAWKRRPMPLSERVREGLRAGLEDTWRKSANAVPETAVAIVPRPTGLRETATWARLQAQARASAAARNAFLDDLAKAGVNGHGAQATYVASVGIGKAGEAAGEAAGERARETAPPRADQRPRQ